MKKEIFISNMQSFYSKQPIGCCKTTFNIFKCTISLVLLICLNTFSLSHSADTVYSWKKTSEDIRIWINQDSLDYDYSWEGENVEGVAHGLGTLCTSKGETKPSCKKQEAYYGSFSSDAYTYENNEVTIGNHDDEGNLNGFAVVITSSGDKEIGEFLNNLPNGHLTYIKNGLINYRGTWVNGVREGEGETCNRSGNCHKSFWVKDKRVCKSDSVKAIWGTYIGESICKDGQLFANGQGKLVSEQDTLEGIWKDNSLVGQVIHKTKDYQYEGEIVDNKYSGKGKITSQNFTFSGTFVDGEPSGYGEFRGTNGNSYLGNWKNGLMNGHGRYETTDYTYDGEWFDGRRNGKGSVEYSNGDYYEGQFIDNLRYGHGHYEFANGDIYEGEFVDDKIQGLGYYSSIADGYYYEGEFSNNKFQGDGSLHLFSDDDSLVITAYWPGNGSLPSEASILFANGDLYEGELKDGMLSKNGKWSTLAERELAKVGKPKNFVHQANDFFIKHEASWRKFVLGATAVFTVAQFIPFPPVAGAAVTANTVLNTVDFLATAASVGVDLYDSVQSGGNIAEPLITIGVQLGANYLATKVPEVAQKAIKSEAGKAIVNRLSSSATTVTASIISLVKNGNRILGKIVVVIKDKSGALVKKLQSSKIKRRPPRTIRRKSDQFVTAKTYKKCTETNKSNFKLGKPGSGDILWDNMSLCMSPGALKNIERDTELNSYGKRAAAHHIVPKGKHLCGQTDIGEKARNILEKCGNIDINDARNGILLPNSDKSILSGPIHRGGHSCKYFTSVYERLLTAKKNDGCTESSIENALDDIKRLLFEGKMSL